MQPLKSGRLASKLNQLYGGSVDKQELNAQIELEKQEFEKRLGACQPEELLDVWCRYVEWIQQTHPTQSPMHLLVPALERCTKQLKQVALFHDNIRFLKLWLLYADHQREANDVFSFLNNNEIGTKHSLFYEEWAAALEAQRNYAAAEKTFVLGITRGAQPLDHLQQSFDRFQQRQTERMLAKEVAERDGDSGENDSSSSAVYDENNAPLSSSSRPRPVLRDLSSSSSLIGGRGALANRATSTMNRGLTTSRQALPLLSSATTQRSSAASVTRISASSSTSSTAVRPLSSLSSLPPLASASRRGASTTLKPRQTTNKATSSSATNRSNSTNATALNIYIDEECERARHIHQSEDESSSLPSSSSSATTTSTTALKGQWKELPNLKEKHKENVLLPSKWNTVSLPQNESEASSPASIRTTARPTFEIFRDEECRESFLSSSSTQNNTKKKNGGLSLMK
ncbi:Checkpoint serine/threonine-protein kinase [Balamuthia mandrillaris]